MNARGVSMSVCHKSAPPPMSSHLQSTQADLSMVNGIGDADVTSSGPLAPLA